MIQERKGGREGGREGGRKEGRKKYTTLFLRIICKSSHITLNFCLRTIGLVDMTAS
jgi:hypothetical protein